jgi:hypothetical protein
MTPTYLRSATQPANGRKRCVRCWKVKAWPQSFIGKLGKPIGECTTCRAKYSGWAKKTPEERLAVGRRGVPKSGALRARLYKRSFNKKLGGIPNSVTSRDTCPPSCSFYAQGCYALFHTLAHHWRRVGVSGDSWQEFLKDVRSLPEDQLWRHNTAGDLPGMEEEIDSVAFKQLLQAAAHTRPFTFTHKYKSAKNRRLIAQANQNGFTINLSADSLKEADRLADYAVGPVAVVLPSDTPDKGTRTPKGRQIVVCPAQTEAHLTCATCRLCAHPQRIGIVGFRSHGQAKGVVNQLVQPESLVRKSI